MNKNETPIYGGKAIIYTNDYDVWQFRCWISDEKLYVRQSLRTKVRSDAIQLAEEKFEDIRYNMRHGKKLFGVDARVAIEKFVEYKSGQVGTRIVAGRLQTIQTHLNHFLGYIGEKTKVQNISKNCLRKHERDEEVLEYVAFRMDQGATLSTVRNEVSSIKMCFKWLYEEDYTSIPQLLQPDLAYSHHNVDRELVRRQTFSKPEYREFYEKARSYVARTHNKKISDDELLVRQLARHYFLFASNSGMRSGELRQLTWENVTIKKGQIGDKKVTIVKVHIPALTTKVRQTRDFMCSGGQYLERWGEISNRKSGLIFSIDGESEIANSTIVRHFNKILKLTSLSKERKNQLVPYSFRHYCVSRMVLDNGLGYESVSQALGTSVAQVERTYLHLNEEAMLETAVARYIQRDKSGIIMFDASDDEID